MQYENYIIASKYNPDNAFSCQSSALLMLQTLSLELVASSRIFGREKSRLRKIEELKEAVR
jgi:hypothetical protein